MRRTQVQLDEPTYQLLRIEAFEKRVSLAGLVREILHQHFGEATEPTRRLEDFRFIGSGRSVETGLEPISERHDEALEQDFSR